MMKIKVLFGVVVLSLVSSYGFSATTTFSWSDFGAGHYLYEADNTTKAAFNTWDFSVYVVNMTVAAIQTAVAGGAAGPLSGSSLVDGPTPWLDQTLTAGDLTDGLIAGSDPAIATAANGWTGWTTYVYFENAAASHCGFIWSTDWTLADDTVTPVPLTMDISRANMGGGSGAATGGTGTALDGWSATNAIPEPGTMALFALGMLTMGARSLRRRK